MAIFSKYRAVKVGILLSWQGYLHKFEWLLILAGRYGFHSALLHLSHMKPHRNFGADNKKTHYRSANKISEMLKLYVLFIQHKWKHWSAQLNVEAWEVPTDSVVTFFTQQLQGYMCQMKSVYLHKIVILTV